jgi:hypothetical protein
MAVLAKSVTNMKFQFVFSSDKRIFNGRMGYILKCCVNMVVLKTF